MSLRPKAPSPGVQAYHPEAGAAIVPHPLTEPTVTEPPVESPQSGVQRPKPTLAQRIVAFAFLAAFGLTMLTVVFTGLEVRSPSARPPETTAVTLVLGEARSVNLVFDAPAAVGDVELTIDLPRGVELVDRPGERRIVWHTTLAAGSNALALMVVARAAGGGELAALLRHGGERKVFVVELAVTPAPL
jgi:hypothetical protein